MIPKKGSGDQLSVQGNSHEGYYRILFENNPLPMWVFATHNLRFLMVNEAAVKLYGYSREEFMQMTIKDIRRSSDVADLMEMVNSDRDDFNQSGEWTHLKKDGTLMHVEVDSHVLPEVEGIARRLVVVHDITARVIAETKLKEAEAMASSILQNIVEIVFSFNEKMEMTYVSPQCYATLGYRPEQFYQDKYLWFNIVHPEDRKLFEIALPQLKKTGEQMQIEYRVMTAAGEERWAITRCTATLDENGKMIRMDGSAHDITEQKQTQERLKFADFSIERASEAFIWVRSDAQVMRVNRAACTMLGYSEEEFLKLKVFDFNTNFFSENWGEHWQALEEAKSLVFESSLKSKDGQIRPVEIQLNYFTFNNEAYSFSSIRDITDRKKVEGEKENLTEETIRQNEHLQQFAYIVSHNLRAPVANIVGLLSLYNYKDASDPLNQMLVNKLERTSHRLDATIKDLNEILTIRNTSNQDLEEVSLETVLAEVQEELGPELSRSEATIKANFSGGSTVLGVKGYINSIFFNLTSNAIKYRAPDRNLEIHIYTVFSNDVLCLHYQDNGLGIDLAKQRQKLFGLYRRFHPHIEGKGLGLHMTKIQIESIGGRIEVDSTVNVGTTFKVFFQVPAKK